MTEGPISEQVEARVRAMKALTKGMLTCVWPNVAGFRTSPDGTDYARYGYSVWLRHMVLAHNNGLRPYPQVVFELGPGASLSVGLAALISGAVQYYAVDVERGVDAGRELATFDRLVELFCARSPIPGPEEFPRVQPILESWGFPQFMFPGDTLERALKPGRLQQLRVQVGQLERTASVISYWVGADAGKNIPGGVIDFAISQAVMERVEDLQDSYLNIARWLRPGGFTSHSIDFAEPLTSTFWNGNWSRSDLMWALMRGGRASWSNREPYSSHVRGLNAAGLHIVKELVLKDSGGLPKERLAARYRSLDEVDLHTRCAYVLAIKPLKARANA